MLSVGFVLMAVKVLDWGEDGYATTAETSALRASFRQEVAVWHKLDHPNVTRVIIITSLVISLCVYVCNESLWVKTVCGSINGNNEFENTFIS